MEIINQLKVLNREFADDGFVIDGLFGSYARDEATQQSDIDLLYHLDERFFAKYSGLIGFKRLDEIKQILSQKLGKKIDLAPANNLSQTGKRYILNEVIYVH
ncbi:MAG: nucleotidyltransferase domain-containing protein [Campylobacterales bacterium]|nr:nucleotidyltransferase domain-containing protein [Campylobacterales bacterium]